MCSAGLTHKNEHSLCVFNVNVSRLLLASSLASVSISMLIVTADENKRRYESWLPAVHGREGSLSRPFMSATYRGMLFRSNVSKIS